MLGHDADEDAEQEGPTADELAEQAYQVTGAALPEIPENLVLTQEETIEHEIKMWEVRATHEPVLFLFKRIM